VSPEPSRPVRLTLGAACLCILCGILTVGLWPFQAPKNDVAWLNNENGLRFGEYGTISSSGIFSDPNDAMAASLEIWMEPGETFDSNDLIAFYKPENPQQFRIEQSGDDLFVSRDTAEPRHRFRTDYIPVDHVFHRGRGLLITVTSGVQGTRIYLNGELAKTSPKVLFTTQELSGVLLIGNSPVKNYSWAGDLRGLAFYGSELTATQVTQDYAVWSKNEALGRLAGENPIAIYPFNERSGSVVHNQITSQPDLFIPPRYFVLREGMLDVPWKEFNPTWGYAQDVLVNIGGLIPLGLFFCAYFARIERMNQPMLSAVLVGAIASLTIEVAQAWLPTRDSSCTDLITNISGTAIGALLYRLKLTQFLFAKYEALVDAWFPVKST
jgi:hypothetical protein